MFFQSFLRKKKDGQDRKGNDKPVRKRTGFISIKEKDRNVGGIAIWKRALMLLHWENY